MKNKCGNCENYIQHFAILDGKVQKIWCGHCRERGKKKLDQESIACELFVQGENVEQKLVNREYLTKNLLKKVLSMALWDDCL